MFASVEGAGKARRLPRARASPVRVACLQIPDQIAFPGFALVGFLASDVLLVGLHNPRQKRLLVATRLLDALEHVPGRLLWPIQLLGELQRGYALARHADLVHDPQPFPNGYSRRFHDRAHLAGELLSTILAVVVALAGRVRIGVQASAFGTKSTVRPASRLEELDGFFLVPDPVKNSSSPISGTVRHRQSSSANPCLFK